MGDTIELELEAMAQGGSAMGWHDNRPVFVPYTIPGERVEARIVEDRGRFARAEGVRLLDASADRVFPRCPHFGPGRCGRCHWQHIDYPAQLLIKQDVLADQLARLAGLDDADVQPMIPSPDAWGYNYHMTFTVTPDGKLAFPGSEERHLEPITECHIIHPDLLALYSTLELELQGVRRVRLQMGTDGAQMIILSVVDDESVPELETDLPMSVNVLLGDNTPMNLIGDSHSVYEVDGRAFRVTAGSAVRANARQLPAYTATVTRLLGLRGGESVLDLYAGVGMFSAAVAPVAGLVTLVESYPPAATDADENLSDFENVDIVEGGVEAVLSDLDGEYQAAIVDPPSEGLGEAVIRLLGARRIERIVYVSSDPTSLARDCKWLAREGYRLVVAQPIDPGPQTYYIDTVALLKR